MNTKWMYLTILIPIILWLADHRGKKCAICDLRKPSDRWLAESGVCVSCAADKATLEAHATNEERADDGREPWMILADDRNELSSFPITIVGGKNGQPMIAFDADSTDATDLDWKVLGMG